jgi:hypothetical protein
MTVDIHTPDAAQYGHMNKLTIVERFLQKQH